MERPEEPRPSRSEESPAAPIGTPVDSLPDDASPAFAGKLAGKDVRAIPPRPAPAIVDELLTRDVPGALPARAQRSRAPLVLAAAFVLLVVALGGWGLAVHEERQRTKRRFLAVCARAPAVAVLNQAQRLPEWLRADADVEAALAVVRARVAVEQARATAGRLLARLDSVATLVEWRAVCDEASAADPTWGEPLARRAEATLALDRGAAVERGDTSFAAARDALRELDLAVERDPASAGDYLLRKARLCLLAPGDPRVRGAAARAAADAALRSAPVNAAVWHLATARLKALAGDWAGAHEQCGLALRLDPERAETYLLRAEAGLRVGDLLDAIEDARRTRARDRWSIDAVLVEVEARALGPRSVGGEGARAHASDELARVLAFDPTHPRALAARAHVRLVRDRAGLLTAPHADRTASRRDVELALRIDPAQPLAHATLAELAFASGDRAEALAAAARAVEHGAHLPELFLLRGRLRARLGDLGALADFDTAARRRPDARAHANRAAVLLAQGKVALARRAADEAVSVDATLPEAYFQRGLSFYKSTPRLLQEAVDDLSRAISLDAGLADAWFYRACALVDARMYTQALADLDRAELARSVRGAFHLREAYLLRGHCLFRLRRWRDSQAAYDEYVRRAPPGAVPEKVTERRELLRSLITGRVDGETIDVENH